MQSERTSLKNQLLKDRYAVEGDDLMLSKRMLYERETTVSMSVKHKVCHTSWKTKSQYKKMIATQQSRVHNYQFYKHSLKPHHLAVSRVLGPTHSSCCSLQHDCHKTCSMVVSATCNLSVMSVFDWR